MQVKARHCSVLAATNLGKHAPTLHRPFPLEIINLEF